MKRISPLSEATATCSLALNAVDLLLRLGYLGQVAHPQRATFTRSSVEESGVTTETIVGASFCATEQDGDLLQHEVESRWPNGLRARVEAVPSWHKYGLRRSAAGWPIGTAWRSLVCESSFLPMIGGRS